MKRQNVKSLKLFCDYLYDIGARYEVETNDGKDYVYVFKKSKYGTKEYCVPALIVFDDCKFGAKIRLPEGLCVERNWAAIIDIVFELCGRF